MILVPPRTAITLMGWTLIGPMTVATQAQTLEDVLAKATAYVAEFQQQLSGVVAEERYIQDVRTLPGTRRTSQEANATHRDLRSELLLVRPAGDQRWVQYRDVFEVDGAAVRDRNERLLKLFLAPSASNVAQMSAIQVESARYNIGSVMRTINVPVLPLVFLERDVRSRFRFRKVNPGNLKAFAGLAVEADVWAVEYHETKNDTVIRGAFDRDMPSHGRFWIDAPTGRVLKTELIVEDPVVSDRMEVTYRAVPELDLLVPAEMREQLTLRSEATRIDGVATYSNFRRFKVLVDETIAPPIQ